MLHRTEHPSKAKCPHDCLTRSAASCPNYHEYTSVSPHRIPVGPTLISRVKRLYTTLGCRDRHRVPHEKGGGGAAGQQGENPRDYQRTPGVKLTEQRRGTCGPLANAYRTRASTFTTSERSILADFKIGLATPPTPIIPLPITDGLGALELDNGLNTGGLQGVQMCGLY